MIRWLLDEGLPRSAIELLRGQGWDAVHVSDCGLVSASDTAILEYARSQDRTICTLDADFHALLATSGAAGPSVVRIRREGMRAADIVAIIARMQAEVANALQAGAVVTVTEKDIRLRRLPVSGEQRKPEKPLLD